VARPDVHTVRLQKFKYGSSVSYLSLQIQDRDISKRSCARYRRLMFNGVFVLDTQVLGGDENSRGCLVG
jgi:hypothetical protein